jgi:pyridoxal phosphate-dependent aminotransferase EpsN
MSQKSRIYLAPPNIGSNEFNEVSNALKSGWVAPVGPSLDEFENRLRTLFPGKEVLAVNSGTSALHLALKLCGVCDGDRVITSSFTFAACANVILYERAIPILLDSKLTNWNMDPDLLDEYLNNCKILPKAIIVTHLYGMPAQMNSIIRVAKKFGVKVIEDAAEALGSKIDNTCVGGMADYGILSFNGNKIITTSGGGALVCSSADKQKGKHLATQANSGVKGYDHREVGYNYRMSNVLAGLGIAQLTSLQEFINKKREIFNRYHEELSESFDFLEEQEGCFSNKWLSTCLMPDESPDLTDLIQFLDDQNIESRQLWKPLHLHQAYSKYEFVGFGICEQVYQRGICLPSGTGLTENEQGYVIDQIKKWLL